MTGIAHVLQATLTDTTLPLIDLNDKVLVAGSLLLVDPTHSTNPWPAGVPANGATLPNIAWARAKAMIGSGDATTLGVFFDDKHQAVDAMFERTGKGGLHGIYSQVNNVGGVDRGAVLTASSLVRDYLYTNKAHRFYFSQWIRRTRLAITTGSAYPRSLSVGRSGFGFGGTRMANFDPNETFGNGQTGQRASAGLNALGNQIKDVDAADFTLDPGSAANTVVGVMTWGNFGPGLTAWANKAASDVFYRAYIEDLTVSGRTYAQVDAIDFALWQAAFAAGGRYNGDTYTDPATFP